MQAIDKNYFLKEYTYLLRRLHENELKSDSKEYQFLKHAETDSEKNLSSKEKDIIKALSNPASSIGNLLIDQTCRDNDEARAFLHIMLRAISKVNNSDKYYQAINPIIERAKFNPILQNNLTLLLNKFELEANEIVIDSFGKDKFKEREEEKDLLYKIIATIKLIAPTTQHNLNKVLQNK